MLANVLIDVEVLYFLLRNEPPYHRCMHTYAGGFGLGVLAGLLMFGLIQLARKHAPAYSRWFVPAKSVSRRRMLIQSLVAGVIGGVSHILLDSFLYREMNPFFPVAQGNDLVGLVGYRALHLWLVISGAVGLVLMLVLRQPRTGSDESL